MQRFTVRRESDAKGTVAALFARRCFPAGERVNGSGFDVDFADNAIPGVSDEHIAIGLDSEVVRTIKTGLKGRATVSGVAGLKLSGDVGSSAIGSEFEGSVARDHFHDPKIALSVKAGAERFLQIELFANLADGLRVEN
jgi:hypothetical protein